MRADVKTDKPLCPAAAPVFRDENGWLMRARAALNEEEEEEEEVELVDMEDM